MLRKVSNLNERLQKHHLTSHPEQSGKVLCDLGHEVNPRSDASAIRLQIAERQRLDINVMTITGYPKSGIKVYIRPREDVELQRLDSV